MARKVIGVGVVCPQGEVSLNCTTSMLRLQQAVARLAASGKDVVHLEVTISDTANAALNEMMAQPEIEMMIVVHCSIGFPADFLLGAVNSGLDMIVGVHPLPQIDWKSVREAVDAGTLKADLHLSGLEYNVQLRSGAVISRYIPISSAKDAMSLFAVSRSALEAVRKRFPELCYENGFLYEAEDVVSGRRRNSTERFLALLAAAGIENAYADVDAQAGKMGSAEFAGCVGMRSGSIR